ncbi:MAG: sigma-54 dependent transcriptional regulator [Blastocatellia bacterium]|nr:sigma-54 dependent transcriptional regulator [Blastocatellia bacterium]MDW8167884.1 sigma-54 dependent transcriptional regulator [Acidobacteriota bacterium]MDW8241531.1 sigma-54 dependent transcriptional regulator [Acidobacteriota bacterium]
MGQRILIIDDDASLVTALTGLLSQAGYDVRSAETAEAALDLVRREPIELALVDIRLGAESGLDLLPQLKLLRPEMSLIVLTGVGTIAMAVEAMQRGADNFIEKPVDPPRFLALVAKGLEAYALRRKALQLERLAMPSRPLICGEGSPMRDVLRLAEAVAAREITVLLCGETGTGKGLLARVIHEASPRRKGPFVELNCAGLSRELTESELFGHERGAFTGAVERKIGLFEAADGGTLFLDEIGEMDPAVQAKLLNALEQKRFRRLGGVAEIEVDVRVIAATNRDLEQDVATGRFRKDLFYRLSAFSLRLPPLRERREDILPLARHFLAECQMPQAPVRGLSREVEEILLGYEWPGNVRELKNVIERAVILCPPGSELLPIHLPPLQVSATGDVKSQISNAQEVAVSRAPSEGSFVPDQPFSAGASSSIPKAVEEAERHLLKLALQAHDWNVSATARELGISRDTLYRKIKKYNLAPEK